MERLELLSSKCKSSSWRLVYRYSVEGLIEARIRGFFLKDGQSCLSAFECKQRLLSPRSRFAGGSVHASDTYLARLFTKLWTSASLICSRPNNSLSSFSK